MGIILWIFILGSAFPAGYLLAYLTRDELVVGRRWFIFASVIALFSSFAVALLNLRDKLPVILSLFYIIIAVQICVWKSFDNKFVKV